MRTPKHFTLQELDHLNKVSRKALWHIRQVDTYDEECSHMLTATSACYVAGWENGRTNLWISIVSGVACIVVGYLLGKL